MKIKQRIATYNTIATELALLSNKQLLELLEQARTVGTSIGGTTALLEIEGKMRRKLPPYISEIIGRNYNSLVVMNDFLEALKAKPKTTCYPVDNIERVFSERIDDQNNF